MPQQHHAGAFATVAFGWVQHHPGQWDRYLVRQCATCRHFDWVKLIWVDKRFLTCLACLSQNVEFDEKSEKVVCNDCHARSEVEFSGDDDEEEGEDENPYRSSYDPDEM